MRYLFLIFLIPSIANAVPATVSWDLNPESEKVTSYNLYKNGEVFISSPLNSHSVELIGGECFAVSAVNMLGESPIAEAVCAPQSVPSTVPSISITYLDKNGNPVVITVPLP